MSADSEMIEALKGKTIIDAVLEKVAVDDEHDRLSLRFQDGTTFVLRSSDADGYQSWMNYSWEEHT